MAARNHRNVTNKFVSTNNDFQFDKAIGLFVRPGKIGGKYSGSASKVWKYFGALYQHTDSTDVDDQTDRATVRPTKLVNDEYHWCSVCVTDCVSGKARLPTKYSLRTSTGTLSEHLRNDHGIKMVSIYIEKKKLPKEIPDI